MPDSTHKRLFPDIRHVAIILDGNGRWAVQRQFGRIRGHREGVLRVDEIVSKAAEICLPYLSLYVFSTENWKRPASEVALLMRLLVQHLRSMDKKLVRNQVKLVAQGSIERLPAFVRAELDRVMQLTNFENPRVTLNLCLSYGGRQEIVDAAKKFATECVKGTTSVDSLTEENFRDFLYKPNFPDPDLLIRTGGDYRVSNFLLWQIAYSEMVISPTLWPDFRTEDFIEILNGFGSRERRYGMTSAQVQKSGRSVETRGSANT